MGTALVSRSGPVHRGLHYNPGMRASFLLFVILAAGGAPAQAAPGDARAPEAARPSALTEAMTLEQAVQKAEKRYKARAVKAEEQRQDDRVVYRIRLLSEDGRVFDVTVDAATGRME